MTRKKPYMLTLDIDTREQERLQRFAALQPEKSVRAFVRTAMRNEMLFRLEDMNDKQRLAVERTIG